MKKTYIRPEATSVRLLAEAALMSVSYSDKITQGDDWSNQRDWNDDAQGGSPWSTMDAEED